MKAHRCVLFVPGSRPERYAKAWASGADLVCVDLEDAVGPGDKDSARRAALDYLATAPAGPGPVLRINGLRTAWGLADLLALRAHPAALPLLMLPKVESAVEIEILRAVLGARSPGVIALIESARGLEQAHAIASAPGLIGLMLGGADYCTELGAQIGRNSLLYARSRLAAAAAAGGVLAIDVPFLDLSDGEGLAAETRHARELGLAAKAAIHPAQVEPIQRELSPTAAEIAQAERILAAYRSAPHEALAVDGKLVDRPIVLAAERILARAGRTHP